MSYRGIEYKNITFDASMKPLYKGVDIGLSSTLLNELVHLCSSSVPTNLEYDFAQRYFDSTLEDLYNNNPIVKRDSSINQILDI